MESNDSPEIPDRGETSDIPGLPLGVVLTSSAMWMFDVIKNMMSSAVPEKKKSQN